MSISNISLAVPDSGYYCPLCDFPIDDSEHTVELELFRFKLSRLEQFGVEMIVHHEEMARKFGRDNMLIVNGIPRHWTVSAVKKYRPETRIHFDEFLACITPKQKNQLLQRTVKAKIDSQNELITLLLKTYPSVEAKLESLNARDHHGQVAFGLSARRRWYVEHYTDMQNIFRVS